MSRNLRLSALTLLLALALPQRALAEPTKATVDKVLDYFHTEDWFKDTAKDFDAALTRRKKEITLAESQRRTVAGLGRRIYPPTNLMKIFRQAYAKATTLENLTALYAWMNTPAGIKLRQALNAAAKATPKQVKDYMSKTAPVVMKPNRRNALNTFVTAWRQDEIYGTTQAELDYAILLALSVYQPAAGRDTPAYLKEKAAPHKNAFLSKGRTQALASGTFVFKDLKNEDVDELSKFAQSPVGEAHLDACMRALTATLDAAAQTLMEQVAKGGAAAPAKAK